jgi:hypothetical protein
MTEKMTAYCGIPCTECDTYVATQNEDDKERSAVAEQWSKRFKMNVTPEDINCDGCKSEGGALFKSCAMCEIRKCGMTRGIDNCAHCDEYACEKLDQFLQMMPDIKQLLEGIRSSL